MRPIHALVAGALAVMLTACGPTQPTVRATQSPSPLGTCAEGTAGGAATAEHRMPDLTLPCFTGGTPVALARLGRPAVLNLWASWCAPCRSELPALQQLADAAGDRLLVMGVVTNDSQDAAGSLAADLHITFPAVLDPDAKVQKAVAPSVLPVTVFVDAQGGVRYVYASTVLDLSTLEDLVRTHLGVVVA